MKQLSLFALFLFFALCGVAQAPDFAWARHLTGNGATCLALDDAGNSYIAGSYNSTLTLGAFTLPYTGPGGNQFLAKFSPDGTAKWAKKFTGIAVNDDINSDKIAVDADGNVYLASVYYTGGTINGQTLPIPAEGQDYFLAKFDSLGATEWIKTTQLADDIYNKTPNAVHLKADGNICMTGLFNTSIAFDAGHVLTNTQNTAGVDAFATTYDADGNVLQALELGVVNPSFSITYPEEIFRLDADDRIYRLVPATKKIIRYSAQGNAEMTKSITASGAILGLTGMAVDRFGNIFLGGWFYNGTLTVEGTTVPGFGSSNNTDALLFKFDAAGTLQWLRHYEATVSDSYKQVRTDGLGNVYAVGQHSDPGEVRSVLTKYSNDGDLFWEQVIVPGPGGPGAPAGWAQANNMVQAHNGGNILVLGTFKERIYFEAGTSFTTPAGINHIFLAQYGVCNTPTPTVTASPSTQFCGGDSVLLTATSPNPFVWNTGDSSQSIYINQTGPYYVLAVEDSECYAQSPTVVVNEVPLPQVTVTQTGVTLTAQTAESTLQWLDCATGIPVQGATQAFFAPAQNGSYAVAVSNAQGCADTSACFLVNTLGVSENQSHHVMLFPNPTQDWLHVSGEEVTGAVVYSLLGQRVMVFSQTSPWDVSSLASGTYFVEVETPKGRWREKFVKE